MTIPSVLFVVYDFPPEGARGTKRSTKFVRHLPKNGWAPVVLTARDQPYDFYDGSMVEEVPDNVPIYRARTLESLAYRNQYKPGEVRDPATDARNAPPPSILRRAFLRLYRGIGKFVSVPDSRILWLPFAVPMGFRLIHRHRCQVIYSSSPSNTNHIVASILSRLTGLPMVIDFRDAWVGDPVGGAYPGRANVWLERFCVRTASFVVCTTDGMREDFLKRHGGMPSKYVTITNGFDPADFPAPSIKDSRNRSGVLRLVHAGTLGSERSPKEFLAAVGQLVRERPEVEEKLEVIFVGKNSPFRDGRTIERYIDEYDCGRVVRLIGYVSRRASLDFIQQADALLLIIGRVPRNGAFIYGISGKIYDYAAARRPVLTIAEAGSTAEMAGRLNLGPVVHPDDIDQIKITLQSLLDRHERGSLRCELNVELLKTFEFSNLAGGLAEYFQKACALRRSAGSGTHNDASSFEIASQKLACRNSSTTERS